MEISEAGINLIKRFEGCRLTAYRDMVGVLTIGYGHTGADVFAGDVITQDEADALLASDASDKALSVWAATQSYAPSQNQFDALVDFAFNLGVGALRQMLAHGWDEVPVQILRWDHAGGVQVAGLTARRQAEVALFTQEPSND